MAVTPTQPGPTTDLTALTQWFTTTRHQLRPDVELLPGLDEKPLLFIQATGKYIAIGQGMTHLLPLFDGTHNGAQIAQLTAPDVDQELVHQRLAESMHELRQAGALTEEPIAEPGRRSVARFMRREHLLRLPLTRSIGRWLEAPIAPLRAISGVWLVGAWFVAAAIGLVTGGYALFTAGATWQMPEHLWVLYIVLFIQIAFHELSHAVVCQYLRVPVREAGVGLMLYIMPVGYVDRTDSYRVRDRKSRAFLSLAGPVNDQIWFGVTGLIAIFAPPQISHLAFAMLGLQLLLTLMNFNPLVPSDGYHALCAMTGAVNFRGKALSYLTYRLLRLPLTETQRSITDKQARGYVWYALGCLLFLALLIGGMFRTVSTIVGALS